MSDIDVSNIQVTTTSLEGTNLVTRDADGNIIDSVPAPPEMINAITVDAKIDGAIAACVNYQSKVAAARASVATLKATATTKSTTATATAAEVRNIYGGTVTVCTQLDAMLAAEEDFSKAVIIALRLIGGRLDAITGS